MSVSDHDRRHPRSEHRWRRLPDCLLLGKGPHSPPTARLNPIAASQGEPEEMWCRLMVMESDCLMRRTGFRQNRSAADRRSVSTIHANGVSHWRSPMDRLRLRVVGDDADGASQVVERHDAFCAFAHYACPSR